MMGICRRMYEHPKKCPYCGEIWGVGYDEDEYLQGFGYLYCCCNKEECREEHDELFKFDLGGAIMEYIKDMEGDND